MGILGVSVSPSIEEHLLREFREVLDFFYGLFPGRKIVR